MTRSPKAHVRRAREYIGIGGSGLCVECGKELRRLSIAVWIILKRSTSIRMENVEGIAAELVRIPAPPRKLRSHDQLNIEFDGNHRH